MKSKLLVSTIVLATLAPMTQGAMAADTADTDSKVDGKAVSGGMFLEADSVDLGKLTVGKTIDSVNGDIRVTDWTGGLGWELEVKSTNYEEINPSLVESIKVGDSGKKMLTNNNALVSSGPSLLTQQTKKAQYSAEWGVAPKVGNQTNELTWTLTPIIPEDNSLKVSVINQLSQESMIMYDNAEEMDLVPVDEYVKTFYGGVSYPSSEESTDVESEYIVYKEGSTANVSTIERKTSLPSDVLFTDKTLRSTKDIISDLMQSHNDKLGFDQNYTTRTSPLEIIVDESSKDELVGVDGMDPDEDFIVEEGIVNPATGKLGTKYTIPTVSETYFTSEFNKSSRPVMWDSSSPVWTPEGSDFKVKADVTEDALSFKAPETTRDYVLSFKSGKTMTIKVTSQLKAPQISSFTHE